MFCTRLVFLLVAAGIVAAAPLDQPTPSAVAEGRRIVHEMQQNPRGPYSRIRWFCNDGTTQPPVAYACRERGGGRQHAEYSAQRERLAALGWSVGTIYASLSFDELFTAGLRQQRLRELALEQYLTDIDNGWVLQSALGYRGRLQVENEEKAGRALLLRLLAESAWIRDNFLLVRESARVIPHGEDSDLARKVRRAAIELAEIDPAAERWRAEIHSSPNAGTADRLRAWLNAAPRPNVAALGRELAADIDRLYGNAGRRERIDAALDQLRSSPAVAGWRQSVVSAMQESGEPRMAGLCRALSASRRTLLDQVAPTTRLAIIDAMQGLESEVQLTYQEFVSAGSPTRAGTLRLSLSLTDCAYGAGLLSATEHAALASRLDVAGKPSLALAEYRNAISRLKRAPNWAVGTIRHTFAEALIRYTALDARAARFSDDLLRSSPMWMLGDILKILAKDLDFLTGSVVEMNGRTVASAVPLNGGVARGTLRLFETIELVEHADLAPTDIAVLPETIAELSPVAGILTLGEGNALSHVQLLARNFGIPNVAIDQDTVDLLRAIENETVVLVVDDDGNVLLQREDAATAALFAAANATPSAVAQITVPVPDLAMNRFLPLGEIGRELSGKVVGPKAANLGELNRLFPGRVAPAVAVPFGVYASHLRTANLMERIRAAFADQASDRIDTVGFNAELAAVRQEIASLALRGESRAALIKVMRDAFGEPGTYGVFVRSDTNVEDLPQFTGAGLNETVPNVVGLEAQLQAIPRVWSSVFSPRALAWRSSLLSNPDQIYASVLLMLSVQATKSGVLVTGNLFERDVPGLTVSAAWGVGGAVAGEPAESIVIQADGVEMYSESKSPYQRSIAAAGGVDWLPAATGPVLVASEIDELRKLAVEVNRKYAPVFDETGARRPWDIEFGFVDGELTLFQIRPLVEKGNTNAAAMLQRLRPERASRSVRSQSVDLEGVPGT